MTSNLEVGGSSPPGIAIYGGGCKTQEGLINPLAVDDRSGPGALPGTPTNIRWRVKWKSLNYSFSVTFPGKCPKDSGKSI